MKNKCSLIRRAAPLVVFCACAASSTMAAESQSGFYLGVSAGQSKYHIDRARFGSATVQITGPLLVTKTSEATNDRDTTFALSFGYRLNANFGAELSMVELGDIEHSQHGFSQLAPSSIGRLIDGGLSAKGISLAVTGTWPVQNFEFYGKLGALYAESTLTIRHVNTFGTAGNSLRFQKSETTEPLAAVGAGIKVTDNFVFKVEWMRILAVGDKNDLGLATYNIDEPDVDLVSGGFEVRF